MAKDQGMTFSLSSLFQWLVRGCALAKARSVNLQRDTRDGERRRDGKALSVKESTPQLRVSQDAAAQCLHLDRAWMVIIILLWTSCCEE